MIYLTTVKSNDEVRQIIDLQKNNLPQNLTEEQIASQGFVTVIHSYEVLKNMNNTEASIIAKDNEKVIGYLLAMTRESKNDIPALIPMFNEFDEVVYNNKKISAYNYIVVGQVCIADGYRSKGILDDCYTAYKNHFKNKYDFAITEIHKNNKRSIKAHARIGFKTVHTYEDSSNNEWDVVVLDWKKEHYNFIIMSNTFVKEFIQQSVFRINESTLRIIKCLQDIDETETWESANENTNSIGNIILHLCGNIRQYAISSLGEREDVRVRDKEFSVNGICNKTELSAKLKATVDEAIRTIENADEARLIKMYSVQGINLSGIGIIIHVTEHYSYHTGQIAFWIKILKNKDLGFYANKDLNVKNKN